MEKKKTDYSSRLKARYPDIEKDWSKLFNQFGTEMVNIIKEKLSGEYSFLKELSQFKFKIIVDNNFIFGQIKGCIKKKKSLEESFLYKLLTAKSIEMFAPYLLQEELMEKVNTVLKEEDREIGMSYALTLLSKIKIQDAQWTNEWKKAHNLIGEYDPDDVSYLALAFDVGVHSILSHDEVFHRQGEVHVWQHQEMGKVITNYNSGFVSLLLMDRTGHLLWKIIAMVFKFVRDKLIDIVKIIVNVAAGIVNGIFKLPPLVLLSLVTLGVIYAEEIKEHSKEFIQYIVTKVKETLHRVKVALKEIIELLQKAIDVVQLGATVTFEFLGFLLNEYLSMYDQIKELNIDFPQQLIPDPSSFQSLPLYPMQEIRSGNNLKITTEKTGAE